MSNTEPSPVELPPPTADRILNQILWSEFLRQMPKRDRLDFLRNVTAKVSAQSEHSNIVKFGRKSDEAALIAASAKPPGCGGIC